MNVYRFSIPRLAMTLFSPPDRPNILIAVDPPDFLQEVGDGAWRVPDLIDTTLLGQSETFAYDDKKSAFNSQTGRPEFVVYRQAATNLILCVIITE